MKKESMRILSIILLSVILLSLIAGIVAAQNEEENLEAATQAATTATQTAGDKIAEWWDKVSFKFSEETKAMISKLLLIALVVMLVYSVMSFIPFFQKEPIKWVASIIIGILSFLFVSADNIRYILSTYEGLGIILTSVLPLIILVAFTLKLREASWTKDNAFGYAISGALIKVVILGYIAYVGIRWVNLSFFTPLIEPTKTPELIYLYPIMFVLGLLWFFIEQYIFKKLEGKKIETLVSRAKEEGMLSIARQVQLAYEQTIAGAKTKQEIIDARKTFGAKLEQLQKELGKGS